MRMNPWAIAIIVMAFLGGQSAASTEPIPTTVPRQERGQSSLSYDGRIEATRTTRVTAQVKGPLIGLEVASGDRVTRGQILARVETQAAEAAVRVNRALTEATREALIQLETQREQHRRLNPLDDPSRTPAAVAQAQFTAIMAELDAYVVKDQQLRAYLALHQIQSPDDGVVAETFVALGDHVKPGTPLLSLFDPHALRLTVAVPSRPEHRFSRPPMTARTPRCGNSICLPMRVTPAPV
jgi:multidrug efflux system membrane fusion protein